MKKFLFGLFRLYLFYAVNAYAASDLLISDNFAGATSNAPLLSYQYTGQSGLLKPLSYVVSTPPP